MSLSNLVPFQRRTLTSDHPAMRGWEEFSREVDKLFDSFFSDGFNRVVTPASAVHNGTLGLNIDISETETAYIIAADMPGVAREDINVTMDNGLLTLSGRKAIEKETGSRTYHRIERRYGRFERMLQLPGDADETAIDATVSDGVLTVTVARTQAEKPQARKIDIRGQA